MVGQATTAPELEPVVVVVVVVDVLRGISVESLGPRCASAYVVVEVAVVDVVVL